MLSPFSPQSSKSDADFDGTARGSHSANMVWSLHLFTGALYTPGSALNPIATPFLAPANIADIGIIAA